RAPQLPAPAIQKARVDLRPACDLRHHRARLVHRRHKPRLLRRAPPPAALNRRDDLNAIHRHVTNLVLATGPTQLSEVHKAALGGVRLIGMPLATRDLMEHLRSTGRAT